jgi:hypothetical protein
MPLMSAPNPIAPAEPNSTLAVVAFDSAFRSALAASLWNWASFAD